MSYSCRLVGGPFDGYTLHWDDDNTPRVMGMPNDEGEMKVVDTGNLVPNTFGSDPDDKSLIVVTSNFHGTVHYFRAQHGGWQILPIKAL